MCVRIEHNAAVRVCDADNDTGDNGPLEPEFHIGGMTVLNVVHHMADAAVKIHLCLPVKIDVRANPQYRR